MNRLDGVLEIAYQSIRQRKRLTNQNDAGLPMRTAWKRQNATLILRRIKHGGRQNASARIVPSMQRPANGRKSNFIPGNLIPGKLSDLKALRPRLETVLSPASSKDHLHLAKT